jgi:hypothetical protein
VDGAVGKGCDFERDNSEAIALDYDATLNLSTWTFSAWTKLESVGAQRGIVGTRFNSDNTFDVKWESNELHCDIGNGASWLQTSADYAATPAAATWYHVAYVVTVNSYKIYLDGSEVVGSGSFSGTPQLMKSGQSLHMGESYGGEFMDGVIDEVRISGASRSSDWIKLCYQNQKASQTLVEFGTPIAISSTAEDYEKVVRFTFSTTSLGLSADVANIPLLLRIDGDDIDFSVTKADGSDLLFMDSDDGSLYHEVVHWDKGNDSGLVWVKESNMENSDGDFITLYYGCSDCSNPYANSESVWNGYTGVWHLNAPEAAAADASPEGNDGVYQRSMPFNTGVTTLYAPSFNGTSDYIDAGDIGDVDGAPALTVSGWVKAEDLDDDGVILAKDVLGSNSQLVLYRDETGSSRDNTLAVTVSSGSSDASVEGADGALNDENWHHVAVTFTENNASGLKLYIDGAEDANSGASTSGISTLKSTSNSFLLGKPVTTVSKEWTGRLGEIRLSTEVKSADYIKLSYGFIPPTTSQDPCLCPVCNCG